MRQVYDPVLNPHLNCNHPANYHTKQESIIRYVVYNCIAPPPPPTTTTTRPNHQLNQQYPIPSLDVYTKKYV